MTYKTHNAFGLGLMLAIAIYQPAESIGVATIILALIANAVGSIAPDMDQGSNKLWSMLPVGNIIGKFLRRIFLGHRAVSHSFLGIWIIYKINMWIFFNIFNPNFVNPEWIVLGFMVGYLSHILIDGLTEEGVPLLWPLPWKVGFPPIKPWRIKTGKWFENLIIFPGILLWIGWMGWDKWLHLILFL
ncbi:metal-dependent hydrolase [Candidatus Shapirobacteria bacterium]|nr:metal-dependent hydrolase [Candidatus Shapirobacteria bacterium]